MSKFQFSSAVTKAVKAAFSKADKAEAQAKAERNKAGQAMVDALILACDQADKAKYWKASGALDACKAVFQDAGLSESAVRNYPKSVRLAFIHGVEYRSDLFQAKAQVEAGIKAADAEPKAKPPKSGAVTSTTREDLDATIRKLLVQARLLSLEGFAAEVLDLALDRLEGFTETPKAE